MNFWEWFGKLYRGELLDNIDDDKDDEDYEDDTDDDGYNDDEDEKPKRRHSRYDTET